MFAVVIISGVFNARVGVSSTPPIVLPAPLSMEAAPRSSIISPREVLAAEPDVTLPVKGYSERRTLKTFGTSVDDDRFFGFHLGEDVEFGDTEGTVTVQAIAPGKVVFAGWAKGYGGVILIEHTVGTESISAIYGHMDSTTMKVKQGEMVKKGQELGQLGEGHSHETDGRRKHLHFALYPTGEKLQFQGYAEAQEDLVNWIDPLQFFSDHGISLAQTRIQTAVYEHEPVAK
jgi:murein DD-endopeptidase MepM/ murein hydrolase activator NlpD